MQSADEVVISFNRYNIAKTCKRIEYLTIQSFLRTHQGSMNSRSVIM